MTTNRSKCSFKVGDKVRVVNVNEYPHSEEIDNYYKKYFNRILTIKSIPDISLYLSDNLPLYSIAYFEELPSFMGMYLWRLEPVLETLAEFEDEEYESMFI